MFLKPRKGCFIMSISSLRSVFDDIVNGSDYDDYDYTMSDNTLTMNGDSYDGRIVTMSVKIIVNDDSDDDTDYLVTIVVNNEGDPSDIPYSGYCSFDDVISLLNQYFPRD